MALSEDKIKEYIRRLLLSRMRILCNHGFYGLLLMHMKYAIDEELETAGTDGTRISFNPDFLDKLSDSELDFVMMHEILHVVLQHCLREGEREHETFNIACDIVVNSNILLENDMKKSSITLKQYGESMHIAPDGKEGYEYTAEQVYDMLPKLKIDIDLLDSLNSDGVVVIEGKGQKAKKKKSSSNNAGAAAGGTEQETESENSSAGRGVSAGRAKKEAKNGASSKGGVKKGAGQKAESGKNRAKGQWDDHSRWGVLENDAILRDVWVKRFEDAAGAIRIRDPSNTRGLIPLFAERILEELRKPQTDWRTILNDFVQEEVVDYSFSPPDRRFNDSPFFLPDFNEKDDIVEDILFMIDTSGSMSDEMITAAYSEIKGAIDQFNGKLKGWLGFFDAAIIEPKPFSDEDEFRIIQPAGGGGTDFQIIFEYVQKHMQEKPPASIIILTDGYAPFPQEKLTGGIPVLWLLNNEEIDPPWGKVARIRV